MTEHFDIKGWHLETNQRGHWLAFNSSPDEAERLVEVIGDTRLGVRAWGDSFRPARNGVSYDWYVLLKSRDTRPECLHILSGLLNPRDGDSEGDDNVGPVDDSRVTKSFWERVISVLPWVHDPESSSAGAEPVRQDADDDDLNARPVYELMVNFDTGSWPAAGVLSELGYKVGRSGLGPAARRHVLRTALVVDLVASTSETESYVREWGLPGSRQRADKIERCLIGFANVASRRKADMSEALADWEDDLAWFRTERNR